MERREEISEWQKLPSPLQLQFYKQVERETERLRRMLHDLHKKLEGIKEYLKYRKIEKDYNWEELRVGVVDGSRSPIIDERLGGRYALFSSSYKIFEGKKLVDEGYKSGILHPSDMRGATKFDILLTLLMTKLEREHAIECLEKDVDWLLIDGSFFGFRIRSRMIREEEREDYVEWSETSEGKLEEKKEKIKGLIDYVAEKSLQLVKERKVVSIVKRVRNTAIDGFLLYNQRKHIESAGNVDDCIQRIYKVVTGMPDKTLLSILMPPKSYFLYTDLFPDKEVGKFYHYSPLIGIYKKKVMRGKIEKVKDVLERDCEDWMQREVEGGIGQKYYNILLNEIVRGYFKAHEEAPVCCFEFSKDALIDEILSYMVEFNNPDTGHPFPLDLVDSDVSLPREFTREFVEEVEASLMRKVVDLNISRKLFYYLNPQAKWRT